MSANAIEITGANFKKEVLESKKPVMIDLWAEWCQPCKMIAPYVEDIAKAHKDTIVVGKVDIDNNPDVATDLSVMNIPTLIFFKNGQEVGRMVGVNSKENIEKKLKALFG